ncbi:hypothetical protein J2795_002480 [Chryseobacterium bernardetii]|jgi:hypothetical protein|uniref:Uncharacterized protein n=3 Tax=Chryseobacterium TaxID=59732 RepID=A0A543EGL5_9FLAO|nr:hypothetical protein [Chryseobacterium vietnamense]MDR6441774.1 hypothetical protein [Chryseobacterium bernardetii]MDR6457219.1 hypothetical protein [Chryseobacterium vietnamense]MDR6485978.1 hypothetical protein [Chryseobacterium vietnamense]TQM20725.1 hypothetical protein FB551_0399 [Chryseobacterium aquifrigidense]
MSQNSELLQLIVHKKLTTKYKNYEKIPFIHDGIRDGTVI